MDDATNQPLDPDVPQAAEEAIQAGLTLINADTLETRADFVQFVGALRRYLIDYAPTADTLPLDTYLGARTTVTSTRLDEGVLPSADTPTWRLFGTALAGAYFKADGLPRPLRIP